MARPTADRSASLQRALTQSIQLGNDIVIAAAGRRVVISHGDVQDLTNALGFEVPAKPIAKRKGRRKGQAVELVFSKDEDAAVAGVFRHYASIQAEKALKEAKVENAYIYGLYGVLTFFATVLYCTSCFLWRWEHTSPAVLISNFVNVYVPFILTAPVWTTYMRASTPFLEILPDICVSFSVWELDASFAGIFMLTVILQLAQTMDVVVPYCIQGLRLELAALCISAMRASFGVAVKDSIALPVRRRHALFLFAEEGLILRALCSIISGHQTLSLWRDCFILLLPMCPRIALHHFSRIASLLHSANGLTPFLSSSLKEVLHDWCRAHVDMWFWLLYDSHVVFRDWLCEKLMPLQRWLVERLTVLKRYIGNAFSAIAAKFSAILSQLPSIRLPRLPSIITGGARRDSSAQSGSHRKSTKRESKDKGKQSTREKRSERELSINGENGKHVSSCNGRVTEAFTVEPVSKINVSSQAVKKTEEQMLSDTPKDRHDDTQAAILIELRARMSALEDENARLKHSLEHMANKPHHHKNGATEIKEVLKDVGQHDMSSPSYVQQAAALRRMTAKAECHEKEKLEIGTALKNAELLNMRHAEEIMELKRVNEKLTGLSHERAELQQQADRKFAEADSERAELQQQVKALAKRHEQLRGAGDDKRAKRLESENQRLQTSLNKTIKERAELQQQNLALSMRIDMLEAQVIKINGAKAAVPPLEVPRREQRLEMEKTLQHHADSHEQHNGQTTAAPEKHVKISTTPRKDPGVDNRAPDQDLMRAYLDYESEYSQVKVRHTFLDVENPDSLKEYCKLRRKSF